MHILYITSGYVCRPSLYQISGTQLKYFVSTHHQTDSQKVFQSHHVAILHFKKLLPQKVACVSQLYRPYSVERRHPTKHQFYRRSKKMDPFYILQMLWKVQYPQPILVILEDAVVIFLQITEVHYLNDLLHITQRSSKWQLAPFYKT
jgi:hypothetical protein